VWHRRRTVDVPSKSDRRRGETAVVVSTILGDEALAVMDGRV
jgi:hypothetical protein